MEELPKQQKKQKKKRKKSKKKRKKENNIDGGKKDVYLITDDVKKMFNFYSQQHTSLPITDDEFVGILSNHIFKFLNSIDKLALLFINKQFYKLIHDNYSYDYFYIDPNHVKIDCDKYVSFHYGNAHALRPGYFNNILTAIHEIRVPLSIFKNLLYLELWCSQKDDIDKRGKSKPIHLMIQQKIEHGRINEFQTRFDHFINLLKQSPKLKVLILHNIEKYRDYINSNQMPINKSIQSLVLSHINLKSKINLDSADVNLSKFLKSFQELTSLHIISSSCSYFKVNPLGNIEPIELQKLFNRLLNKTDDDDDQKNSKSDDDIDELVINQLKSLRISVLKWTNFGEEIWSMIIAFFMDLKDLTKDIQLKTIIFDINIDTQVTSHLKEEMLPKEKIYDNICVIMQLCKSLECVSISIDCCPKLIQDAFIPQKHKQLQYKDNQNKPKVTMMRDNAWNSYWIQQKLLTNVDQNCESVMYHVLHPQVMGRARIALYNTTNLWLNNTVFMYQRNCLE